MSTDAEFEKEMSSILGQAGGLTADAAATRAAKSSPDVRRHKAEVDEAYQQAKTTELVRVPHLDASIAYNRLSSIPSVALGTFSFPVLLNQTLMQANLSIPLSDYLLSFPTLVDAAKFGETAARQTEQASVLEAASTARVAYYEWVRARLQVLVASQLLDQVTTSLGQVQAQVEAQHLSKVDLLRAQAAKASVEQTIAQLRSVALIRESQLRSQLGAKEGEQLSIGEDVRQDVVQPTSLVVDPLVDEAVSRRLDVRAIDSGIEAKRKLRSSQSAGRYPKLNAVASVLYADPNQRFILPEDKFQFTWAVGASLTWNLNDALTAGTKMATTQAQTDELSEDRNKLLLGLRLQITNDVQQIALANRALQVSIDGLQAAEEGYRVRRELFEAERATLIDLIDSETQITQARLQALNARIDLRVALANLQHDAGHDVQ